MEKKLTYGVWAVRSSTSIFGPAQSWCKENGKPLEFDSKADAENYAKEANEHMLIHTEKGRVAFEKIRKSTKSKQVTFDQAVASNRAIIESCVKPQKREAFMKNLDNDSIEQLAKEYLKQQSIATQARIWLSINVKKKIKNLIKRG